MQDGGLEEATSGFLWEKAWRREWVVQSWGKETSGKCPVKMQHSSGNVYIGESYSLPLSFLLSL
jgi:hypothetical protein